MQRNLNTAPKPPFADRKNLFQFNVEKQVVKDPIFELIAGPVAITLLTILGLVIL